MNYNNFKKLIMGTIFILSIFWSYSYLTTQEAFNNLSTENYSLKTYNINKSNKWSTFRDEKNGNFLFIQELKKHLKVFLLSINPWNL